MNKIILFILSILIILITCDEEEPGYAKITCKYKSYGYFHCVFWTRSSCCYTTNYCRMLSYVHRCESTQTRVNEKRLYEKAIQNEYERYDA